MTIKEALTALFLGKGGNATALADNKTVSDVVADLADVIASKEDLNPLVIARPVASTETLFNTLVSAIQTGVEVVNNAVIGELKHLSTGEIAEYWGAGNFIALKFIPTNPNVTYSMVKVGLDPSEGSGLVTLDADWNGVFKVTDKDDQKFKVVVTINGVEHVTELNLSGLVCANE